MQQDVLPPVRLFPQGKRQQHPGMHQPKHQRAPHRTGTQHRRGLALPRTGRIGGGFVFRQAIGGGQGDPLPQVLRCHIQQHGSGPCRPDPAGQAQQLLVRQILPGRQRLFAQGGCVQIGYTQQRAAGFFQPARNQVVHTEPAGKGIRNQQPEQKGQPHQAAEPGGSVLAQGPAPYQHHRQQDG